MNILTGSIFEQDKGIGNAPMRTFYPTANWLPNDLTIAEMRAFLARAD